MATPRLVEHSSCLIQNRFSVKRVILDKITILKHVALFSALDPPEIDLVASIAQERSFKNNERIIEEGCLGEGLFVMDSGTVNVSKTVAGQRRQPIAKLRQGEHFGEMSLLTETPTSASVTADGLVKCLFIPKAKLLPLLDDQPKLGRKVFRALSNTLSSRLSETDQRWAKSLHTNSRHKAIWHVLKLAWMQLCIIFSYLWVLLRIKVKLPYSRERLAAIHRKNARRFKRTACQLKGANVKIGQLASLQGHLLPQEVIDELRAMRDNGRPTEYPLIANLIQYELGRTPLELFAEFEKTPLATASMGQVHKARLLSGEEVVVKVLHPGLEQSVAIDLWLLRKMLSVLSILVRKIDLLQMFQEIEEPMQKELDLLHEAHSTEEIAGELKPLGVLIPKVYWRYTTRRVLTLEYIEGTNLDNLDQIEVWNVDRTNLARTYLNAFLKQAFQGGFFHCDPHPANAFCTPDGNLALLDFGMVKRLPEVIRLGLFKEMLGGFFNNPKLYADGIIERGVIEEVDRASLEKFASEVFSDPNLRSALFDHDIKRDGDMRNLSSRMGQVLKELQTFKTPQDELMFLRALGIVIDVAKLIVPETQVSLLVLPVLAPIFAEFLQTHPEYMQYFNSAALTQLAPILQNMGASTDIQRGGLSKTENHSVTSVEIH